MEKHPRCPHDGSPMRRDVRPYTVTYKGQSETVDAPGWYCDECGEGILNGAETREIDDVLHYLKAQADGLLKPEDIRRIRKKLKLSQEKAGELIGGGPRAFQKYESGDVLPSRAISNALRLLDHDPSALAILQMPPHPEKSDASRDRTHA
jgi:HTH-type transcriptional regulator/antitoxin MqsA